MVGIDEIVRGHGIAVRPLRVLPQKEAPFREVGVRLPAFRDARFVDRVVRDMVDDEALEERAEDVRVAHRGDDVRIERLWFGPVPEEEDFLPRGPVDAGFLAAGTRDAQDGQTRQTEEGQLL